MSDDAPCFVIVGASLAGLRAAEALRDGGYAGRLVLVGDEPHPPYDRPPFTKQVALGMAPADRTVLPHLRAVDAEWRLGTAATRLELESHRLVLSQGEPLSYDKLLIATGRRARPWPVPEERQLEGVIALRTREDADRLKRALDRRPERVVVVGGGFNGSELASACRDLDLPVTLLERGPAPLVHALGGEIGRVAADLQRRHGVDLRCGVKVTRLEGDASGHVRRVHVKNGASPIEASLVIVALGTLPNIEWLEGSGLMVDGRGAACDAACQALGPCGRPLGDIYIAGDVACFPHPVFDNRPMALEHWSNAVEMGRHAGANMLRADHLQQPYAAIPTFWSSQFEVNIKSLGAPALADRVQIVQGAPEQGHFIALYSLQDRLVGAVGFNQGKWLQRYAPLIAAGAPPPPVEGMDAAIGSSPTAADFPHAPAAKTLRSAHVPSAAPHGRPARPSA